jgi:hypothetical protein
MPSHIPRGPSVAIPSVRRSKLSPYRLHPHFIVQVGQTLSEALHASCDSISRLSTWPFMMSHTNYFLSPAASRLTPPSPLTVSHFVRQQRRISHNGVSRLEFSYQTCLHQVPHPTTGTCQRQGHIVHLLQSKHHRYPHQAIAQVLWLCPRSSLTQRL